MLFIMSMFARSLDILHIDEIAVCVLDQCTSATRVVMRMVSKHMDAMSLEASKRKYTTGPYPDIYDNINQIYCCDLSNPSSTIHPISHLQYCKLEPVPLDTFGIHTYLCDLLKYILDDYQLFVRHYHNILIDYHVLYNYLISANYDVIKYLVTIPVGITKRRSLIRAIYYHGEECELTGFHDLQYAISGAAMAGNINLIKKLLGRVDITDSVLIPLFTDSLELSGKKKLISFQVNNDKIKGDIKMFINIVTYTIKQSIHEKHYQNATVLINEYPESINVLNSWSPLQNCSTDISLLDYILQDDSEIKFDKDSINNIMWDVTDANLHIIKQLCEKYDMRIVNKTKSLSDAINNGQLEVIKYLLKDQHADINSYSDIIKTSAASGHMHVVDHYLPIFKALCDSIKYDELVRVILLHNDNHIHKCVYCKK